MSKIFPVMSLTDIEYVTKAEMRTYSRLLGNFWELLGRRRSLSTEGIVQVEAGMGKAAWGCSQGGRERSQEARKRGEGPILYIFLWAPVSGHAERLSTPWTSSYTNLVLLKPFWVHPFTRKSNSHDLSIVLMSIVWSSLDRGGTFILSMWQVSDWTCTQSSLERHKQENGKDRKIDGSGEYPMISRNRAWISELSMKFNCFQLL